jgi:hypothetical protein
MKYYCFILSLCILITSCDKDDDEPTKTALLTSGSWKFNDGGMDVNNDGAIDLAFGPGTLPACLTDNSGLFNSNGTGINDEGLTKCNPTDPQTSNFNWNFESNETVLNISGTGVLGITGKFKVLDLTSSKLTLSRDTLLASFPSSVGLIVNLKH